MDQEKALEMLKTGENIFLTGSAGTGKTFLLNRFIEYLKKEGKNVGITASTGIAATQLGGRTIHSWLGIKIENEFNKEVKKSLKNKKLKERIKKTDVLIIDEISMLDAKRFDLVNQVLKFVRESDLPFGGVQVVLCGDFFQLPPIVKEDSDLFSSDKKIFAYHSLAWEEGSFKVCYLDKHYRQKDKDFVEILDSIRENKAENDIFEKLRDRIKGDISFIKNPTKLYTHNINVDSINNKELSMLTGREVSYKTKSEGEKNLVEALKKSCLVPEELILKKGARVMFVKNNFDKGFVNGTLGEVVDFDEEDLPIVEIESGKRITASLESWVVEEDDRDVARISQIPLRLAWAITVHKSQGMSLDAAEIDLSRSFELGMGYVALSRVRTLEGIKLVGINEISLRVNEEIVEKDKEFKELSNSIDV